MEALCDRGIDYVVKVCDRGIVISPFRKKNRDTLISVFGESRI